MRRETSVLVDANWQGQPRKLMLHANRNGFFYVFDRTRRQAAACQTVRQEPDVGQRHRRRRPADQAAQPGAVAGGHEGVPVAGRRDQLVLAVVQPRDRPLLHADVREVQHLHQDAIRATGKPARRYLGGSQRTARDPKPQRILQRDRHPDRRRSRGSCRSPARPTPGAARSPPPAAWSSSARTAARLMAADAVTRQAPVELPDQ